MYHFKILLLKNFKDFPGGAVVKNLPANAGNPRYALRSQGHRSRKWQPIPVFLPGKSHGQRSLADYSPWGYEESDASTLIKNFKAVFNTIISFQISFCLKIIKLFYSWFTPVSIQIDEFIVFDCFSPEAHLF